MTKLQITAVYEQMNFVQPQFVLERLLPASHQEHILNRSANKTQIFASNTFLWQRDKSTNFI
jgi:hypothetical protein